MSEPLLHTGRDGGLKGHVDRVRGWTVAVLMGLSVVNVLWQVASRFLLGDPSSFTDEAARFLLIWVGLLGAAYASGQRMHLAIDLLPRSLQKRGGTGYHAVGVLIQAAVIGFALGAMVFGGAQLVSLVTVLHQISAALGLPLGAVYAVLPVSGLLVAFYAALRLADHVRGLRGKPLRYADPASVADPVAPGAASESAPAPDIDRPSRA